MPRVGRMVVPGLPHHVAQRGHRCEARPTLTSAASGSPNRVRPLDLLLSTSASTESRSPRKITQEPGRILSLPGASASRRWEAAVCRFISVEPTAPIAACWTWDISCPQWHLDSKKRRDRLASNATWSGCASGRSRHVFFGWDRPTGLRRTRTVRR